MTAPEDLVRHHYVTVATRSTLHKQQLPLGVLPEHLGPFVRLGTTMCGEDARGMTVVSHDADLVRRNRCSTCLPDRRSWWVRFLDSVSS